MNGFERLMRNLGLMVHNVRKPEADAPEASADANHGRVAGESSGGGGKVIVRRTTIEEVEVRPDSMD